MPHSLIQHAAVSTRAERELIRLGYQREYRLAVTEPVHFADVCTLTLVSRPKSKASAVPRSIHSVLSFVDGGTAVSYRFATAGSGCVAVAGDEELNSAATLD